MLFSFLIVYLFFSSIFVIHSRASCVSRALCGSFLLFYHYRQKRQIDKVQKSNMTISIQDKIAIFVSKYLQFCICSLVFFRFVFIRRLQLLLSQLTRRYNLIVFSFFFLMKIKENASKWFARGLCQRSKVVGLILIFMNRVALY